MLNQVFDKNRYGLKKVIYVDAVKDDTFEVNFIVGGWVTLNKYRNCKNDASRARLDYFHLKQLYSPIGFSKTRSFGQSHCFEIEIECSNDWTNECTSVVKITAEKFSEEFDAYLKEYVARQLWYHNFDPAKFRIMDTRVNLTSIRDCPDYGRSHNAFTVCVNLTIDRISHKYNLISYHSRIGDEIT